ncbi:HAD family hydrolase [Paenibacillus sp. FSL R7-0297]|uniref:HAD family hydrolase n=1 Tax=unclassified Paenibacillus TaxID=185978 RepID=UPI0004F87808|nr:HAD family hydrolase [Paenibacillus sp. FSL R5-0912]AIQ40109.1 hydrolase [Paenibacillus sp. FSL R5-0912]
MQKKPVIFLDSGDTLIDEGTELRDGEGIVICAQLIPGADMLVRTLFERGYLLALVADGEVRSFDNIYSQNGLDQYFSAKIYSGHIGVEKPDPRMFRAAADALGLGPSDYSRILMMGNNLSRDIRGANALGMISVFLSWTPRYPLVPADEEEVPDYTISEPLQLLELVERLVAELRPS